MVASLRRLVARCRNLFASGALDHDFSDELQSHVAMLTDDNVRRGMTPDEARRAALLQVGSPAALASLHREVRTATAIQTAFRDLRLAWRSLVSHPTHTIPVVLTLALGVGATTALFSVLDSTLWRRVPFAHGNRLVEIWNHYKTPQEFVSLGGTREQVLAWRGESDLFEWVEAYESATAVYQSESGAHLVDGALVTPTLFRRLGVAPTLGTAFLDADGRPGSHQVVMLSHSFWSRELGRDAAIVEDVIRLDGQPYIVRGVMPAHFRFPDPDAEIWLPYDAEAPPPRRSGDDESRRDPPRLVPIGLARIGDFSRAEALVRARGEAVNASAINFAPNTSSTSNRPLGARLYRFGRQPSDSSRHVLLLLAGAALMLLLIVCVNVAALTLSRDLVRAPGVAIRAALGASRATLLREALLEHLLAGVIGATLALIVAGGVIQLVMGLIPATIMATSVNPVDIDVRVLVFTIAAGLLSGLLFGLPAAVKASTASVAGLLQGYGRGVTESRWSRRMRAALVGVQISLSLVLLTAAGLMGQSVLGLYSAHRGYDPDGLLRMRIGLPQATYADGTRRDAFQAEALLSLRAVPGVLSVAAGELPPSSSKVLIGGLEIDGGHGLDPEYVPRSRLFDVTPDYFMTLRMPLRDGRTFHESDSPDAVVVSESFVNRHWPGLSAIGKRFRLDDGPWRTVIGVVADVRRITAENPDGLGTAGTEQMYQRSGHGYDRDIGRAVGATSILAEDRTLMVRVTEQGPARQALIDAIARTDPSVIVRLDAVDDLIAGEISRSRLVLHLLTGFAAFALLVSAVGLYGLMAYAVAQRHQEFGIRIALGASPRSVSRGVIAAAFTLTLLAVSVGLAAATALGTVLQSELYGVHASDLRTLATVSILIGCTALVAAWRPAARASRVDPATLLRSE
jgi:macrolide transport system ATP-binding/permease protein